MTTKPQLPNHLIRELMHIIRLKRNRTGSSSGDAMVLLALSGKEPTNVFQYVVETHVYANIDRDGMSLQSKQDRSSIYLKFKSKGSKRLTLRFVKLTTVDGYHKSFTLTLKSLIHLEDLKLEFDVSIFSAIPKDIHVFFNEVNKSNLSFPKLRKLDISLKFEYLLKLLSTIPLFPLLEDVTIRFDLMNGVPNLVSPQTFPNVKHLMMDFTQYDQMTSAMLHHISAIFNCFTGLETAKMKFRYDRYVYENPFSEVVELHNKLRNTNFSFPVEADYYETASLDYPESPTIVYEQLKSIGFQKEESVYLNKFGGDAFFVLKKEFGNVKLNHHIRYIENYRPELHSM